MWTWFVVVAVPVVAANAAIVAHLMPLDSVPHTVSNVQLVHRMVTSQSVAEKLLVSELRVLPTALITYM